MKVRVAVVGVNSPTPAVEEIIREHYHAQGDAIDLYFFDATEDIKAAAKKFMVLDGKLDGNGVNIILSESVSDKHVTAYRRFEKAGAKVKSGYQSPDFTVLDEGQLRSWIGTGVVPIYSNPEDEINALLDDFDLDDDDEDQFNSGLDSSSGMDPVQDSSDQNGATQAEISVPEQEIAAVHDEIVVESVSIETDLVEPDVHQDVTPASVDEITPEPVSIEQDGIEVSEGSEVFGNEDDLDDLGPIRRPREDVQPQRSVGDVVASLGSVIEHRAEPIVAQDKFVRDEPQSEVAATSHTRGEPTTEPSDEPFDWDDDSIPNQRVDSVRQASRQPESPARTVSEPEQEPEPQRYDEEAIQYDRARYDDAPTQHIERVPVQDDRVYDEQHLQDRFPTREVREEPQRPAPREEFDSRSVRYDDPEPDTAPIDRQHPERHPGEAYSNIPEPSDPAPYMRNLSPRDRARQESAIDAQRMGVTRPQKTRNSQSNSKVIYVTGSGGGVGKTTFTWIGANTTAKAVDMSPDRDLKQVYLLETDYRNPKLQHRLNIDTDQCSFGSIAEEIMRYGESNTKITAATLRDIINQNTYVQEDTGLRIITCPYNVSGQVREYMEYSILSTLRILRGSNSYIFLDAGTLTSTEFDRLDSMIIKSFVDRAIVVSDTGHYADLLRACRIFTEEHGYDSQNVFSFLNKANRDQVLEFSGRSRKFGIAGHFPYIEEIDAGSPSSMSDVSWVGHASSSAIQHLTKQSGIALSRIGIRELKQYFQSGQHIGPTGGDTGWIGKLFRPFKKGTG